jgi:hypothetical protein
VTKEYRVSNYERADNDQYYTEPWCTEVIVRHIPPLTRRIWEPAAGRGDMVRVLLDSGYQVEASDLDMSKFDRKLRGCKQERDFFKFKKPPSMNVDAIITNPPYGKLAEDFVRHALSFTEVPFIAMLLRVDWDSAGSRVDLFTDNQFGFSKKLVLLSRPRWDWWKPVEEDEIRKSPMHNYAWFIWGARNLKPNQFRLEPTIHWEAKNG